MVKVRPKSKFALALQSSAHPHVANASTLTLLTDPPCPTIRKCNLCLPHVPDLANTATYDSPTAYA